MNDGKPPAYGLEVVICVSNSHRRELLQTLEGLHEKVTREGRATCEVLEDSRVPNRFLWVERWPSLDEAEASRGSGRFSMLMAAIHLLGSVEAVRQVRIDETAPP